MAVRTGRTARCDRGRECARVLPAATGARHASSCPSAAVLCDREPALQTLPVPAPVERHANLEAGLGLKTATIQF